MSHVTTGEVCITDLEALESAVRAMGGTLKRNQRTFKWFGRFLNDWRNSGGRAAVEKGFNPDDFGKCEHAIQIPGHKQGCYEVGVVKRQDGKGFTLMWDHFGSGGQRIAASFGDSCSKLKTEYGIAALKRAYRGRRVEVTRTGGKARVRIHA